jgi:hypothetical protein
LPDSHFEEDLSMELRLMWAFRLSARLVVLDAGEIMEADRAASSLPTKTRGIDNEQG